MRNILGMRHFGSGEECQMNGGKPKKHHAPQTGIYYIYVHIMGQFV